MSQLDAVEHDKDFDPVTGTWSSITKPTAVQVQAAVLATLVTGQAYPPCRLSYLKSLIHPKLAPNVRCGDRDCTRPDCHGNHLSLSISAEPVDGDPEEEDWWFYQHKQTSITCHVVHTKNQNRGSNRVLKYNIPKGNISKLLLAHIEEGHSVLTMHSPHIVAELFTTNAGSPFADCSFTQYWETLMKKCPVAISLQIRYFPPSTARSMFVEHYTSAHGVPPDMWDGAAAIMDNSVRQWTDTYARGMRNRNAQRSVDFHAQLQQENVRDE
jgi:hypothetical protein